MKITYLLILTSTLFITGCSTNGVYDPVRTAQVEEAIRPIAAAGVRAAALSHPQYIPYINAVGAVFCKVEATGQFKPSDVIAEINKLAPPSKDPVLLAVRDNLTGFYAFFFSKQVVDIAPDKWPAHLAKVLCESIDSGLAGVQ